MGTGCPGHRREATTSHGDTRDTCGFQRASRNAGTAVRMNGLSDEVKPIRYNLKGGKERVLDSDL